ncbi:MAG: folate family ECF transporter S component [Ruminococcaceae bacterium]|nr:folate family ECF transporter S component [Oscillospiraceae bacterium]
MSKKQNSLFLIILTALLIVMNIILERVFSYFVPDSNISLSFIPVTFAATFLPTPYTIAVGAIGDILGALLFPVGAYFPGFTITNIFVACISSLFLYKNASLPRIVISVFINKTIGTLLLNSYWLYFFFLSSKTKPESFFLFLGGRAFQFTLMLIIEIVINTLLFHNKSKIRKVFQKNLNKYIH